MDCSVFRRENRKYSTLWMNGYKDANWKRLAKVGLRLAKTLDGNPSLIDLGFGRGSAMDFFENSGIYVEGAEISKYAVDEQQKRGRKVYHTSLDNMEMLRDNQFNIGFCNDVIEHVPQDLVVPSLNEIARVCSDYVLMSVCPTPSHHLSLDGKNLHLTVKPESWWEEFFRKYGAIRKINFLFSRSARYVIDLKS